jgi:magnesium-transporting ATPase (P-type)
LSKAEASVAAPFTSNVEDISCIPNLIMEGRCALVTTFGMFRYMALYSLIQFTSVLILYLNFTNFPDAHFLLVDLGITTMIALVLGRTGPFKRIVPKTPKAELVSIQNICSVLAQVILAAILQISAIYWLQQQPWYIPIYKKMANADDIIKLCWETTTIVSVSSFQYLTVCIIFSTGPPYRLRFYTNRLLLLLLTGLGILCTVIAVYPVGIIATLFSLMPLDNTNFHFRLSLLVFPVAGAVIAAVLEKNIKYRYGLPAQLVKLLGRQKKKTIYEETLENLSKDVSWPPIKP